MQYVRQITRLQPSAVLFTSRRSETKDEIFLKLKKWQHRRSVPKTVPKRRRDVKTIDIWKGMSFFDVGRQVEVPHQRVMETLKMMYPDMKINYRKAKMPIDRLEILTDFTRALGARAVVKKSDDKSDQDAELKDVRPRPPADPADTSPRAPVVTIMGHVDHGKTTLLDALRSSRIVESEFGGITQHIGAFSVRLGSKADGRRITFLDTPGHAAFHAMRQRGANCTDLVVLVVAADDGVMPQTMESIRFAAAANVPILVALNKIDAPNADVEAAKKELMYKAGLVLEEDGGDVQCVPISALHRRNLDELQEAILIQAELMDLRAQMDGPAEAVVLEAHSEKGRGKVATCLMQRGKLERGAVLVAGTAFCRVRAIFDETGDRVKSAQPSDPVEVIGWKELPITGDVVLQVKDESKANEVVRYRQSVLMEERAEKDGEMYAASMTEYRSRYKEWLSMVGEFGGSGYVRRKLRDYRPERDHTEEEETVPKLNVILKGDVVGSVEAIVDTIAQVQGSHLYELSVVEEGVGPVTESDIELAGAFDAIVYAFNVPVDRKIADAAAKAEVRIREFKVIYHLAHDLREEIISIIPPVRTEVELGSATVLQIFQVTREGTRKKVPVAGCNCEVGVLQDDAQFRVLRTVLPEAGSEDEMREEVVFDGPCTSLYHKRRTMREIRQNTECGLMLVDDSDEVVELVPGDRIVCYRMVSKPQEVDIDFAFD